MINSYNIHLLVNLSQIIVWDFWMVKIGQYFHESIWVLKLVFFFFNFFPKKKFLKALFRALLIWILWVFILGLHNWKMISSSFDVSFNFWLGVANVHRWVNIYKLNITIMIFKKITTISIWIFFFDFLWTYVECKYCCFWATIPCIRLVGK
jgi:hypothetical protein